MNPFQTILHWLRAGYPDGVPQGDYVALLGVLRRSLTPVELEKFARRWAPYRSVAAWYLWRVHEIALPR